MADLYSDVFLRVCIFFSIGLCIGWLSFFMIMQERALRQLRRQFNTYIEDMDYTIGSHRERISVLETRLQERSVHLGSVYAEEREEFWNPLNSTHPIPPPFISERKKPGRKPGSKNKPKEIAPEEIKNP